MTMTYNHDAVHCGNKRDPVQEVGQHAAGQEMCKHDAMQCISEKVMPRHDHVHVSSCRFLEGK